MSFGNILKQLRSEFGINQNELANRIGISRSSIAMYETNQRLPDYETIVSLSNFFNVSSDFLLELQIDNNNSNTLYYLDNKAKQLSSEDLNFLNNVIDFLINKSKK